MVSFFTGPVRFWLICGAILGGFAAIFLRLVQIQVWNHDYYAEEANKLRSRYDILPAPRGEIVDRRGNLVAATRSVIEVGVDPQVVVREDFAKLPELARLLGLPESEIESAFLRRERVNQLSGEVTAVRWVRLAEAVGQDTFDEIRSLGIRAVYGNHRFERRYPAGSMAAHIVGFINRESTPVSGVERAMDFYLRGQEGWRQSENDGRRRELARFREREVNPTPGLNVELTVDLVLQTVVEREVARIVEEFSPEGVSIIISRPETGDILALANYPTFDPNRFWEFPVEFHRNRSLTDVYEPGSTFKVVTAAAAMQAGLVGPETVFDCSVGQVQFGSRVVSLPRDHRTYGEMSVEEIVVRSSNRGVAFLGLRLGEERLYQFARSFGFGEPSGILTGPESRGILHPVNRWDGLTITRLPMGHAVSATPMQVHQATSVIANNGILMQPRVVQRVYGSSGETVLDFPVRQKRRVVSPAVAGTMAGFLEMAVRPGGTGANAYLPNFGVAGKTGTTQMIINGAYSRSDHVASFSGFFPANDPRVVMTVVVTRPQLRGTGYGGTVAAPAFRRIAEEVIHHLRIPPMERDRIQTAPLLVQR